MNPPTNSYINSDSIQIWYTIFFVQMDWCTKIPGHQSTSQPSAAQRIAALQLRDADGKVQSHSQLRQGGRGITSGTWTGDGWPRLLHCSWLALVAVILSQIFVTFRIHDIAWFNHYPLYSFVIIKKSCVIIFMFFFHIISHHIGLAL